MALLVTGTRLALARPAYGLPALRSDGHLGARQVILIAAGACALVVGFTAPGGEALAEIIAIIVIFPLSVTRSWPRRAAALLVSVTAGMAWMFEESWVSYTIAAAFISVAVMTVVRPRISFRAASAVGLALAGWDFIGVSVTHATLRAATADPFSGLAPQGHAAGPGIPGLIGIPAHAVLLSPYAVGVGIGDVALPGILIVTAGRAGRPAGAHLCRGHVRVWPRPGGMPYGVSPDGCAPASHDVPGSRRHPHGRRDSMAGGCMARSRVEGPVSPAAAHDIPLPAR
jgi:hypothetical protein